MEEAESKVIPVRRAEDNYRLAKKYMDAYVDSLVDEEKVRKENVVLIECIDRLVTELREIKGELSEIKQQNKVLAQSVQLHDRVKQPIEEKSAVAAGPISAKQFEDLLDDDDFQRVFRGAPAAEPVTAPAAVSTALPAAAPTAVPVAAESAAPVPEKKKKADKPPKNKVVSLVSNIMFYLCMGLLLVGAITFAQSEDVNKSLFGFRYYYIKTASMEPVLPVGSIVLTKVTPPEEIKVGDDITVYVGEGKSETYLTHRVVEITQDQSGGLAFRTKGVNAKSNDPAPYSASLVAGKVVFCVPLLGTIMTFVQTQLVFVIAIFALLLLLSFMIKLMFAKKDPVAEPISKPEA